MSEVVCEETWKIKSDSQYCPYRQNGLCSYKFKKENTYALPWCEEKICKLKINVDLNLHMQKIVDYLYSSEFEHMEEYLRDELNVSDAYKLLGDEWDGNVNNLPNELIENHIFTSIKYISNWLTGEQNE